MFLNVASNIDNVCDVCPVFPKKSPAISHKFRQNIVWNVRNTVAFRRGSQILLNVLSKFMTNCWRYFCENRTNVANIIHIRISNTKQFLVSREIQFERYCIFATRNENILKRFEYVVVLRMDHTSLSNDPNGMLCQSWLCYWTYWTQWLLAQYFWMSCLKSCQIYESKTYELCVTFWTKNEMEFIGWSYAIKRRFLFRIDFRSVFCSVLRFLFT